MKIIVLLTCALTLGVPAFCATEVYLRHNAVEVKALKFPLSLLHRLRRFKVVILGEGHGTVQTPLAGFNLACDLATNGPVTVALEISTDNQKWINTYLATGDDKYLREMPHFEESYPDGRSSLAMFDTLRSVRKCKDVGVLFFSPEIYNGNQDANTQMAENILKFMSAHPKNRLVILTGNIHGSTRIGFQFDPTLRPMGYELTHSQSPSLMLARSAVFNILARYGGGESWGCLDDVREHCGPIKEFAFPEVYSHAVSFQTYFAAERESIEGYDGTLFFRKVSASPPFSGVGR